VKRKRKAPRQKRKESRPRINPLSCTHHRLAAEAIEKANALVKPHARRQSLHTNTYAKCIATRNAHCQ
jgi:hypothetical protein